MPDVVRVGKVVDAVADRPVGSLDLPEERVGVVDCAGAGDAFAATLAVLLAEGTTPGDAAARASRASTFACRALGAQAGLATREELS